MNGELPGLFTRVRGISILRTSCILQSWSRTKKESMDEKDEARDLTVNMGAVKLHLSPDVFHRYAGHYYKCKQDFVCPDDGFSPVPYFLLCRAIELQIKARHLKRLTQKEVKNRFRHHLLKAYKALDAQEQILSQSEVEVLTAADQIYGDKEFEYFRQEDASTGSSRILRILGSVLFSPPRALP